MTAVFLSLHVIVAIVAIGPITVAGSMFPRAVRALAADPADASARTTAALLHRVCRGYAALGVFLPVFGIITAVRMGVLGDVWVLVSLALTALAAALLALLILPRQRAVLALAGENRSVPASSAARLGMLVGIFNTLWAVVTVLMIVRPGSTTGV
ncbi:hypothetical protein ACFYTQ_34980 [Nocardia sp. NPDC004068]|uniref:hypothetical protein n=1 Tax=Nocardia sp. NPDC004068 TaxID=3364303 RepID=UPI0036D1650D